MLSTKFLCAFSYTCIVLQRKSYMYSAEKTHIFLASARNSVGRCVEIWAPVRNFWVKVFPINFRLEKYIPFKKKDVSNFFLQY